jgi:hypothetical protein
VVVYHHPLLKVFDGVAIHRRVPLLKVIDGDRRVPLQKAFDGVTVQRRRPLQNVSDVVNVQLECIHREHDAVHVEAD